MKYRRRIKRRFTRAVGEKYGKKRIQEIRINESNKNERILGKQLELL